MEIGDLKYIVGQAQEAEPAYMRFYGDVTEESTHRFNDEFLWLTECVKPSKIVIGINSPGGSVIHGMGTFSLIQTSPIETETVIEGLAASMGSIIWAAGTRSYMRDYSILMIHNPFLASNDGDLTPDQKQSVAAFQQQLEMIYHRRFGLSKSKVQEIMNGQEGCDGTYFDAKGAVKAGIIPADHVIKTPKQVSDRVHNQLEGVTEIKAITEIMASANKELVDFKPLFGAEAIHNQNQTKTKTMEDQKDVLAFSSICSQLGLSKDSEINAVVNRLNELQNASKELQNLQNSFNELKIKKEGADAELANVKNELTTVKNELKVYRDAEEAKRNADIEAMVDAAIEAGKITAESKDKWVEMAKDKMEMVQDTLASIPARDKISQEIANDAHNIQDAHKGMTDAEKEIAAKVEEAVGKDFKFRTLED